MKPRHHHGGGVPLDSLIIASGFVDAFYFTRG